VSRALEWIDRFGDRDRDGFVEYARRSPTGLVHQGWKDSQDAIFHDDGRLAEAPIALCEVQAYVYEAKRRAATLAELMGERARAAALLAGAEQLRERFERDFWIEELGTYALALDDAKRPCRVRTSNAGHALFDGLADASRARRVAAGLLDLEMFTGWDPDGGHAGAAVHPMSYHNGSVWPHDNAIIAAGFDRYGLKQEAIAVLTALFEVSQFVDLQRMPELVCGFHRRAGEGPTLYPVACAPQAWAAGAVYLLLQACLGLRIDAVRRRITLNDPRLPEFLREIRVRTLAVGASSIDLLFERHAHDVGVTVLRKDGNVELVVVNEISGFRCFRFQIDL
jgi:glycogen debranching enzyme